MKCEHCKWYVADQEMVEDKDRPPAKDERGRMRRHWTFIDREQGQCRFNPPSVHGFPKVTYDAWCSRFADRIQ